LALRLPLVAGVGEHDAQLPSATLEDRAHVPDALERWGFPCRTRLARVARLRLFVAHPATVLSVCIPGEARAYPRFELDQIPRLREAADVTTRNGVTGHGVRLRGIHESERRKRPQAAAVLPELRNFVPDQRLVERCG